MIAALLNSDLSIAIRFVYCSLFAMTSLRKVIDPEWSFYSATPPFTIGGTGTYTVREKPITKLGTLRLILTHYVLIFGSVAVGGGCLIFVLSGKVAKVVSAPTWLVSTIGPGSAGAATTILILVVTFALSGVCLSVASRTVYAVWDRLYTPIDLEAEQASERAAKLQKQQALLRERREEQEQLTAPSREQEQRKLMGRMVLERLGIAAVLDEPESPMSRFYVTKTFTRYGDPLAPFREKFAPLADANLRELLEQAGAVSYDPAKTIDVEPLTATDKVKPEQLELPSPKTTARPKPRLEALSKVREEAVLPPSEDASPAQAPDLPRVEGHIAEHLWDNLRTDWRDVIDSPVAKAEGSTTPPRGRYVPEQLVLSEALLEATLGGRPAGLKGWRYKGKSVPGMLLLDIETAERYPELYAWLQERDNRERLLDLEIARDDLEALSLDISVDDIEYGEGPVGGWRPPTLALTERAWILAIGYVPTAEATTSRGIKEPLWKIDLPVDW